jgi:hypothetical protein
VTADWLREFRAGQLAERLRGRRFASVAALHEAAQTLGYTPTAAADALAVLTERGQVVESNLLGELVVAADDRERSA